MEEKNRGFIIIYTIFITTFCFILALASFKLENLQKINNQNYLMNCLKVNPYETKREYFFTELDEHIHSNVVPLNDENMKAYFNSKEDFILQYDICYLKYLKDKNCFLGVYFLNGEFYKEELYSYKIKKNSILYGCIKYSFKRGELKEWVVKR